MSAWRRRAIKEFPDLQRELQSPSATIYGVFFLLLPRCREAHRSDSREELGRIYVAWCSKQKAKDLWNAAAMCFYEHLVDQPETIRALPRWLDEAIFRRVESLFGLRLGEEKSALLKARYLKAKRDGRSSMKW